MSDIECEKLIKVLERIATALEKMLEEVNDYEERW